MEKNLIKRAIMEYYHNGHVQSDGELYREILHDIWKIFWINEEGKIASSDKEEYISWYKPENRNDGLEWKTEFYYIDISGNIGSAKIKISNQEFGYIDYFNLMKEGDRWWIVNKISRSLGEDE
jgi:hypothetical protein